MTRKGYIVTSPSGSVSLKALPVPVYATRDLAGKAGRASGERFSIVEAVKFYASPFGRMVRALAIKRQGEAPSASAKPVVTFRHIQPALMPAAKPTELKAIAPVENALTKLLNRLKAAKQEKAWQAKVATDTRAAKPTPKERADLAAKILMPYTLQRETNSRRKMADASYLSGAMQPPKPEEKKPLSDSDLFNLYNRQEPHIQQEIDIAAKFAWNAKRVNKLVKSGSIKSILILFRAGKLPMKARMYRKLRALF